MRCIHYVTWTSRFAVVLGMTMYIFGCAQKDDTNLIQGSWKCISSHTNGEIDPSTGDEIIFKHGKLIYKSGERKISGSYNIETNKNPKWIDLVLSDKTTFLGIYELSGEELTICHGKPGDQRSTDFASEMNSSNCVLTVFKRITK